MAEWQTQWTQNPPGATPCEFDSRLGHPRPFGRSFNAPYARVLPWISQAAAGGMLRLGALYVYPIKSAAGLTPAYAPAKTPE